MSIADIKNSISNPSLAKGYQTSVKKAASANQGQPAQQEAAASASAKTDTLVTGSQSASVTYSKPTSNKISAQQLMEMEQQRTESFTQMLQSMVVKQGQASNLTLFGLQLHVTPADSAKAAASIAPGGEYSVDAVAGRIMDMAKALAGGDSSKIAILREAVQKGFKAAGIDLGGELPGICQDTYTETMNRFDQWEQEMNAPQTSTQE